MRKFIVNISQSGLTALAIIAAVYFLINITGKQNQVLKTAQASVFNSENAVELPSSFFISNLNSPSLGSIGYIDDTEKSNICLVGRINNFEYTVKIDTGMGFSEVLLGADALAKLGCKFTPLGQIWKNTYGGIAYPGKIEVAGFSITNPSTTYIDRNLDGGIYLGLAVLERFSYLMIDNRSGMVRFSNTKFEPLGGGWHKFPARITTDKFRQKRLITNVNINGKSVNMMFDTCGGDGIKLTRKDYQRIKSTFKIINSKNSTINFSQFGSIPCRRVKIDNIAINSIKLDDLQIIIPEETFKFSQNILPISTFGNRPVIIDIQSEAIWVK